MEGNLSLGSATCCFGKMSAAIVSIQLEVEYVPVLEPMDMFEGIVVVTETLVAGFH